MIMIVVLWGVTPPRTQRWPLFSVTDPPPAQVVASLVRFGIDPLWELWLKYANNRNWLSTVWAQLNRVNSENNTPGLTTESHSIIKLTSEMMMRTDPGKQCNNRDIKSWLGMGNCHGLFLSAFIWWKVCVSVWWVRAYYRHDMAGQAIPGPLSCVFCKTLVRYVLLSLRRSWPVPEPARDPVMVYLKASGPRLRRCPHLTDWRRCQAPTVHYQAWAAAIKIVTVITPSASQSGNGQISHKSHPITSCSHGRDPHTSPASCPVPTSPSPPPTP